MKNFIYNYYGIYIDELKKDNEKYYFTYNNCNYMISLINNTDIIEEVYSYMLKNNVETFNIVLNKDNNLYSTINNKNYILLKLHGILNYELNISDFKTTNISDKSGLNWGELWSNKIDYYELQVRELGIKHQTLLNTFGFFHGLASNAILYYNLTVAKFKEPKIISISHNRIKYPCLLKDYINPANCLFDFNVRDISEYIKSYLFSNNYDIEYIIEILSRLNTNNLMFNLLYSRLLYPSFYFDIFDEIILNNKNDNEIIKCVNISNRYLNMLKEIYICFYKKYDMFKIEWLDKIKI